MRIHILLAGVTAAFAAWPATADTTQARCDIYPAGSDQPEETVDCTFSQRQGFISITRADGTSHELAPDGDVVGNFTDQSGAIVYRQSGLGDQGLIFRFPTEAIYLYWATGEDTDPANATAMFSTDEYDATAILRCGPVGAELQQACPAGAARMEDGQASVTVQPANDSQFTLNFMKNATTGEAYVNASNRTVEAVLNGDTWRVTVDEAQVYEVPLIFIEGD